MTAAVRASDFAQLFLRAEAGAVRKEAASVDQFENNLVKFTTCIGPLVERTALECRVLTAQLQARRTK